jgi:hypothetical protein
MTNASNNIVIPVDMIVNMVNLTGNLMFVSQKWMEFWNKNYGSWEYVMCDFTLWL